MSKNIRALEESLGVVLFVRVNRGLLLTDIGASYIEDIRPALVQLERASARLLERKDAPSTLTLRILAILGDRWLLPRFASFVKAYPHIDVQFTSLMAQDGRDARADGEFRFGEGIWPGFAADYLFGREMVLVASPALLDREKGLDNLHDVARFTLLQHFQVPYAWTEFFDSCDIVQDKSQHIIRYEFYSTLLKSAVAGMGLALVPKVLVDDEIQRGELVNPLAAKYRSRHGYYFVVPEDKLGNSALAALRAWLLEEAAVTLASSIV